MHIGLINWSGHGNLGDDAMATILQEYFGEMAQNMGEHAEPADAYILGGGTLISPGSLYPNIIQPEKTVGISLGVSSNWDGEHKDVWSRMRKIFVRDEFSYNALRKHGIDCELSVDLCCALKPTKQYKNRGGVMANIMYAPESPMPNHKKLVDAYLKDYDNAEYFAMSPDEDVDTVPWAKVYTDAQELVDRLAKAEKVVATRLHAHVLAWVAGVEDIHSICYDPKIIHFNDRVAELTPVEAREIINRDLSCLRYLF